MPPPALLLATSNPHKVAELRRLLVEVPFRVVTPRDLGLALEVEEDGATFRDNAIKKARAFAEASGVLSLADDSGIEVEALDGRPGVRSARYGGSKATDEGRVRLLLQELREVPWEQRACRYVAVVAVARPGGEADVFEGTCSGMVAREPAGTGGFGYDPIFYVPDHGLTVAQMPPETKDRISHRGHAVRQAAEALRLMT